MSIDAMRREYDARTLHRRDLADDPFEQFRRWFDEAVDGAVDEPNAMSLATAAADGAVTVRTVLLKDVDADGFAFYTNLASAKARDLGDNPRCALLFPWLAMQRQVGVRGTASPLPRATVETYFATRPRASQLGAWASRQSEPVASRDTLEAAFALAEKRFADGEIPAPPFWGGFRVRPVTIEFWQGRAGRLHDRFRYARGDDGWRIDRLNP